MVRTPLRSAVALITALLLGGCSADPGPAQTSAADAPLRAPTTTAPPPPVLSRVAVEPSVLDGDGDQRMVAVAAGVAPTLGSRFVAVGVAEGRPASWWSVDGSAWERVALAPGEFGDDASIADVVGDPVGGGWVAVGAEGARGAAWVSLDGLAWERADIDQGPPLNTVGATRLGLMAFGTGGTGDPGRDGGEETVAWQSFSGRRWIPAVDDPELFARPGRERVVAVVDTGSEVDAVVEREGQGPEVWRSTDGLFWSLAPAGGTDLLPAEGRPGVAGAIALGSSLAVVGTDTKDDGTDASIWLSTGAQTYRQMAHDEAVLGGDGAQAMAAVARSGDHLVVVGTETDDWGDVDALVWSGAVGSPLQRADDDGLVAPRDQHARDVAVLGSTTVAVGWEETPDGTDAVVWVVSSVAPGEADPWPGPAVAPGPALGWQRVAPGDEWSGPGEQRMEAVTVAGDGFVAAGSVGAAEGSDAAVWRSVDGQEWRRVGEEAAFGGPGDQRVAGVAAGNEGLVAVGVDGGSGAIWSSSDGDVWLRVAHDDAVFGGLGDQQIEAVVASGEGGWVAVGSDAASGSPDGAVWRSPDGLVWTRARADALEGPGDQRLVDIVDGPEGLVAVGVEGDTASAWTSADGGSTWSRTGIGTGQASGLDVSASGAAVAVGSMAGNGLDAAVWRSDDGSTWAGIGGDELGGLLDQELAGVVAGEEVHVAVGRTNRGGGDDAAAWASDDGLTWVRSPHAEHIFGGDQAQRMLDVASIGGLVVAVGTSGSTPEASDGAVWITDLAGGGARANL